MAARRTAGISGVAVTFAALGGYMVYAGIRNVGVEGGRFDPIGGLRDLLSGQRPPSRTAGAYNPPGRRSGSGQFDGLAGTTWSGLPTGPVPQSETVVVQCRGRIGAGALNPTIRVHRSIAPKVDEMLGAAHRELVMLCGNGWRSTAQQRLLRAANGYLSDSEESGSRGRTPVAVPGRSRHEFGLAIDFHNRTTGAALTSRSPEFSWLARNAARFGFRNLPSEPWHWSTDGR